MVIFANERILVFRWLQLGLNLTENDLYMDCLALVNDVLSLVNSNEAKCQIANSPTYAYGVYGSGRVWASNMFQITS